MTAGHIPGPGRDARGRMHRPGKQSMANRGKDLHSMMVGANAQLDTFEWCVDAGFLQDRRLEACPKCGQRTEVIKMGLPP